jgi:hypothetical protein
LVGVIASDRPLDMNEGSPGEDALEVTISDSQLRPGLLSMPSPASDYDCLGGSGNVVPEPVARISHWPLAFSMADAYRQLLVSLC